MGKKELHVHVLVASSKWHAKPHEQHTKCDVSIQTETSNHDGRKIEHKRNLAPMILSFELVSSPPISVLYATPKEQKSMAPHRANSRQSHLDISPPR